MNHFLKSEKQKIKDIEGLPAKLEYIWDYYKLWIIGIAAFIVVGIYLLTRLNAARSDYDFYLILANTMENVGTDSSLCRGFRESASFETENPNVVFNNQIYFDFTLNTTGNTYFNTFIVFAEAGTLDAITMETESLVALGQTGRLMDLNDEAAAAIKEKYEDRFLYYETVDEQGNAVSYPIGIDVSDSILMTQYHVYGRSCALGLGYRSENTGATLQFLDYILQQ